MENLSKKLAWNKAFIDFTQDLDKIKPLIICGDLNVAHTKLDVANPEQHTQDAGFTMEERNDMSASLDIGFTGNRHILRILLNKWKPSKSLYLEL